jgi:ribose transport system substrate-binding protein
VRLVTTAAAAATLATAAIGCGGSGGGTTASSAKAGGKVAILSLVRNAFDSCKDRVMEQTLSRAGFDVSTYYSNFQPATSNANLQDALTKQIAGAVYASQTPALDLVSLKKLQAANVKTVLNLGQAPSGTKPAVVLPAASEQGGAAAVDELLKVRPSVKRVGLIPGTAGVPASDLALKGMAAELAKRGVKVVATVHGDFTPQSGSRVAQDMLQAHPDIQALLVLGDDMALAAARVGRAAPAHAVVVDVYGFGRAALAAVRSGGLAALMYAPVDGWARRIADSMVRVMRGQSGPRFASLRMRPVDRSNVGGVRTACS